MKAKRSPFRPTFGVDPPTLSGRDPMIAAIADALDEGTAAPGRMSLVTGARGIGKTIVLNAVEAEARQRGWLVMSETLTPGLLSRLVEEHVPEAWRAIRAEVAPDPSAPGPRRRIAGVTLPMGLGGVAFATSDVEHLTGLRAHLGALAGEMERRGAGVLVTVDEIHRTTGRAKDDFRTLAGVLQHLWRDERSIAFVGAGLPSAVQDLLNDDVLTFLRRAERWTLGLLDPDEVADAIRQPVEEAGRRIDDGAVDRAVALARGYPYLVQLVGDLAWRHDPTAARITPVDVDAVADRAVRTLGLQVHQPAVADLSERDRDFLLAMLPDVATRVDGATAVRDLLDRLGVDNSYASRYRQRLIASGLVRPDGRGRLAFALPYLADYLRTLDR